MPRIFVDVRPADLEVLERVGWREHRQTKELASYVLHQWAEAQRALDTEAESEPAAKVS
jgi:hypothetical protein